MTLPLNLNYFDVVLLALLGIFTVRGALRGFVDEVAGLVGLLLGVYAAGLFYEPLGQRMAPAFRDSTWAFVLAYVVVLVATMLVIALAARVLHKVLKIAYADWINHMAGGIAGLLKGLLACVVLVGILDFFLADAAFVRTSRMAPVIREVTAYVKAAVPENVLKMNMNKLSTPPSPSV